MPTRSLAAMAAAALIFSAVGSAQAHQLNVFASTDCETVRVEAKFSSGKRPVKGEVRISNGNEALLLTRELGETGIIDIPMAEISSDTGLFIEVDTGGHDDYWIMTPEDIAQKCQS